MVEESRNVILTKNTAVGNDSSDSNLKQLSAIINNMDNSQPDLMKSIFSRNMSGGAYKDPPSRTDSSS